MHTFRLYITDFFRRYPWILFVCAAAFGVAFALTAIYTVRSIYRRPPVAATSTLSQMIRAGRAPIPELTERTRIKLASGKEFAAVLSYTDRGFEPETIRLRAGEMVRFTNNSSGGLWVAVADGSTVYPRTYESCGSSDLDSCEAFLPQDFWEFTFDVRGTWKITNNLDKSRTVTVIVE